MSDLKNISRHKNTTMDSNRAFWNWFSANEKEFHNIIKEGVNIKEGFFSKLTPKLNELNEGFTVLTRMVGENNAELTFSANGAVRNFDFVEELFAAAPDIKGWKFRVRNPKWEINLVVDLKNISERKNTYIDANRAFWNWFSANEKEFHNIIKEGVNIKEDLFSKLIPKLNELKEGFTVLTRMVDENNAELIFSANGAVSNFVFVEELFAAAPDIKGWKFGANNPEREINLMDVNGYHFSLDNLSFYPEVHVNYPDEIEIVIVYDDFNEENRSTISDGICFFLDNLLGEIRFATMIDELTVISTAEARRELIPIEKLKPYLIWREKEFVAKYEDVTVDTTEHDTVFLEAERIDGSRALTIINRDLLKWEAKMSHPWMLKFEVFCTEDTNRFFPQVTISLLLFTIEEEMMSVFKDENGQLRICREISNDKTIIYFACKEFRNSSKIAYQIQQNFKDKVEITYEIHKDKYWRLLSDYDELV
jgi:hypothetical protein